MQNLRDKLLKAGLVSESDSKKAEQEKASPPPRRSANEATANRGGPRPEVRRPQTGPHHAPPSTARSSAPAEVRIPKLPPLVLPGTKAFQRLEALKQQERDKLLRETVYAGQVAMELGTHAFHFVTRKGKLRRLDISDAQAKLLEEGKLAVVERQEPACIEHSLVPPEVADRMIGILEKSVRFYNRGGKPVGFLSDEELKGREEAEARGEAYPGDENAAGIDSAPPEVKASEEVDATVAGEQDKQEGGGDSSPSA